MRVSQKVMVLVQAQSEMTLVLFSAFIAHHTISKFTEKAMSNCSLPLPPGGLPQELPLFRLQSLASCYNLLHNIRKHKHNTRAARTRMHPIARHAHACTRCGRQENHMCSRTHNAYMYEW